MGKKRLSVGVVLTVMGMALMVALPHKADAQTSPKIGASGIKGYKNGQGRIERNVIRKIPRPTPRINSTVGNLPKLPGEFKAPLPDVKKYERKKYSLKSGVSSLDSSVVKKSAADSLKLK